MLIDPCCRLCAPVADRVAEVERCDAMLAESALERGRAVHRFGSVISHKSIVVPKSVWALDNRCTTFEQGPDR
jgi:hypothetical protein